MARTPKDAKQMALFDIEQDGQLAPPVSTSPPLSGASSLAAAVTEWEGWMARRRMSPHTIKSFRSDLNLLARFIGRATPVGEIGTRELKKFLKYLREGRSAPCSPKSYQRRLTSLKNFFKWLHEEELIPYDPAAPILHEPVRIPMPEILYEDEIAAMLQAAARQRSDPERPDARPYLLFTLLLKCAMKKGEAVAIAMEHLDLAHPGGPVVYVRYSNPRYALKERKLALPDDFASVLPEYIAQYEPEERLFECTPRNLEYVLTGLAEDAGVTKAVSFEMVRITAAVNDRRAGMESDTLRQKLGLSEITWRETGGRIEKLAAPAL